MKYSIQTEGDSPNPISLRTAFFARGTVFPRRRRSWGKLNYALSGACEFNIEGVHYISPPQYGIWIPPGAEHEAKNSQEIHYVSVYVAAAYCVTLPQTPTTLGLSPLLKAIPADFAARGVTCPSSMEDQRLSFVLIDQIRLAPRFDSYLPFSNDKWLDPILRALQAEPGNQTSLAEWAEHYGTTERTLSRRFQTQLGISFREWRQRMRFVTALTWLDAGEPVHRIAIRLGYRNPSAFIAMFRRLAGTTPMQLSS
ncbi:AraC family transcriptional regulator [Celerinatantimonas sp. YJH-8]|uniref:AraC family transcriptional regulator n=1 Tax=Celerinatantimonas sp. YJH-8 TaxID=3228714 RepID=UPI0038C8AD25